jgi:hypothetical protein
LISSATTKTTAAMEVIWQQALSVQTIDHTMREAAMG